MSGASGKVLAAIHVTPEALDSGPLARVVDGDLIRIDAGRGTLETLVPESVLATRDPAGRGTSDAHSGMGRELFSLMRRSVGPAEHGATFLFGD
jgi:phosphogluconate dehydratase